VITRRLYASQPIQRAEVVMTTGAFMLDANILHETNSDG
jgi:hypothetical protein